MDVETATVTIEVEDGGTEELSVPRGLLERLVEGEESLAASVGDVVVLSVANNAHHWVHHAGEADEELAAEESARMAAFEERFGMSFGEMTGHQH